MGEGMLAHYADFHLSSLGSNTMVKIITDTTACLKPETIQKYEIPVIPQVINFGNESFLEGVEMDLTTFMQRLKQLQSCQKQLLRPLSCSSKNLNVWSL
jgi:hypothetical protein